MKSIASARLLPASRGEGGFTLTELVAALLVASLLVVGIAELTHRYARTFVRVKADQTAANDRRTLGALLSDLVRAEPETLVVSRTEIKARVGEQEIVGRIRQSYNHAVLEWSSATQRRTMDLPRDAHFEKEASVVHLEGGAGGPPLAMVRIERDAPFDCQFDTIARACR